VDGEKVGEGRVQATAAMIFSADDTCGLQIDLNGAAEDPGHLITPEERLHIVMARQ
jgi:hypothetical protein